MIKHNGVIIGTCTYGLGYAVKEAAKVKRKNMTAQEIAIQQGKSVYCEKYAHKRCAQKDCTCICHKEQHWTNLAY